ncbi:hypothetical protein LPB137_00585 [Poseidonibacter parvus]|uniref:Uncharacterized protein n=1 Tax=Poseidonibacter parvus TaxID=1850254 RepID=A0A1P8KIR4_9BACT|nr:hypothetical protein [Poseidonibacter parvus]APW64432.1 hypothetical protein LPB137_00585 [Poseidonibacter parvus]
MINDKELNELFEKKKEYFNNKTKDEIKDCITKDSEYNVVTLKLELKDFGFFKEAKNVEKLMIYFGVYDNDTNEYLDYSTYSNVDINADIILSRRSVIVKKINKYLNFDANLSFKIFIVPIIQENEDLIFSLEQKLYLPDITSTNNENFLGSSKKLLTFLYSKILPIFIFILIPANVYIYLIKKIGLVESLIDISTITTTVIYLLNETINILFDNLLSFFIGGILFIPVYLLIIFFFTVYGFYIFSKVFRVIKKLVLCNTKNEYHEILYEKITIKRLHFDLVPMIKSFFSTKYIYLYSLTYSLLVLFLFMVFFITQIADTNKNSINSINKINTVISIAANEYIQYSAFPKLANIKLKNESSKKEFVLFMGYDKTYSYYYDISYINNVLSKYSSNEIQKFMEDYKKHNNHQKIEISFQDIFKTFLAGHIDNNNIKAIKNDMYEFYDIGKFSMGGDIFSKLKDGELSIK